MNTKGFFIGQTSPRASFERRVATDGPRLWTPDRPAGAGAVTCAVRTTTSLSSGSVGGSSTCSRGSEPSPQLSDARDQEYGDAMTGTEDTDRHDGVVVGLVLLAAAFVAGGFAGFLLALLIR